MDISSFLFVHKIALLLQSCECSLSKDFGCVFWFALLIQTPSPSFTGNLLKEVCGSSSKYIVLPIDLKICWQTVEWGISLFFSTLFFWASGWPLIFSKYDFLSNSDTSQNGKWIGVMMGAFALKTSSFSL